MAHTILHIAVPSPVRRLFDYLPPSDHDKPLLPGTRIRIPFRNKTIIGILDHTSSHSTLPTHKLKHALEVLDDTPIFSPALLALLRWASQYYHHALGEVMATALPTLLRQGRAIPSLTPPPAASVIVAPPTLTPAQTEAVTHITQHLGQFQPFLLYGITGSGKTEVYARIIENVLAKGQQALVLVPEISLTPQTLERFQQCFSVPVAVFHSGLTDRERLTAWTLAHENLAPILIGTRSAVFTPMRNPGVIIVDEEHEPSLKQQEGFRYSARDVAIMRASLEHIPIVLGSATPSLESFLNVEKERYRLLHLPLRTGGASTPTYRIIDLRNQKLEAGISPSLLNIMQQHLDQQNQVLLFLNRRGFAPTLLCHNCGWIAHCRHCDAALTLHQAPPALHCHHCGGHQPPMTTCPECHHPELIPVGAGTERIEQFLRKAFPDAPAIRIDRDSTRRKGSLQQLLHTIHTGDAKILIGTQMLAKGHHFPGVTLSVVLNTDGGLYSTDFRAVERMGQLITQVAGRAGRAERAGEVVIQTHHPDHPLLQTLLSQGYQHFAMSALRERLAAKLPPYRHLALLRAESTQKNAALSFLTTVKETLRSHALPHIELLGPIPALMEKRAGHFRSYLLLRSAQRGALHMTLDFFLDHMEKTKAASRVRWSLDIDPVDLS